MSALWVQFWILRSITERTGHNGTCRHYPGGTEPCTVCALQSGSSARAASAAPKSLVWEQLQHDTASLRVSQTNLCTHLFLFTCSTFSTIATWISSTTSYQRRIQNIFMETWINVRDSSSSVTLSSGSVPSPSPVTPQRYIMSWAYRVGELLLGQNSTQLSFIYKAL